MIKKRIGWIEDDIDVIDPVVKPLRLAGFEILEFRTYSEACDNIDVLRSCELILLDLILPSGRSEVTGQWLGLELLKELQQRHIQVPIIILSVVASSPDWQSAEFRQLDITPISKPVRPSVLKAEVYRCLGLQSQ